MTVEPKLGLDPATVATARRLAQRAGAPVVEMARTHTTVSVERAVLRLAGITGADPDGIPWVNRLVDTVRDQVGLEHGVALPVFDALVTEGWRRHRRCWRRRRRPARCRFRIPSDAAAARKRPARRSPQGMRPHRRQPPRPRAADRPDRGRPRASRGST